MDTYVHAQERVLTFRIFRKYLNYVECSVIYSFIFIHRYVYRIQKLTHWNVITNRGKSCAGSFMTKISPCCVW